MKTKNKNKILRRWRVGFCCFDLYTSQQQCLNSVFTTLSCGKINTNHMQKEAKHNQKGLEKNKTLAQTKGSKRSSLILIKVSKLPRLKWYLEEINKES